MKKAERIASAAEEAAGLVALAVVPGTEAINAETAAFLASTIRAAAVQAVATATARQVAADQVTAADLILSWAKVQKQNAHANLMGLH